MIDQLWVSAEVKRGSVVLVSPTILPTTVEHTFGSLLDKEENKNNEIHNSYNDIHMHV